MLYRITTVIIVGYITFIFGLKTCKTQTHSYAITYYRKVLDLSPNQFSIKIVDKTRQHTETNTIH